jgi:hypothetical protein
MPQAASTTITTVPCNLSSVDNLQDILLRAQATVRAVFSSFDDTGKQGLGEEDLYDAIYAIMVLVSDAREIAASLTAHS